MKCISHIPTEQFGFVEIHHDATLPEVVASEYRDYAKAFQAQDGLPTAKFESFVQRQLEGVPNHVDEYNEASQAQKDTIQLIKRLLKRLEAKQAKQ